MFLKSHPKPRAKKNPKKYGQVNIIGEKRKREGEEDEEEEEEGEKGGIGLSI